ncbi:MAG: YihY/virulence factor BrkB family protein [Sulfuritalea sp.]|nr:YihY/virulence factor BrkB family protein [Sulfuritalea sp.]MDP1981883.1 YihY/virulence factor BrkB family protein [Sulfuritalea sp.]
MATLFRGAQMKPNQILMRAPAAFAWRTLKGFGHNQGVLLAGAVAYYALLSLVPLLILVCMGLSRLVEQAAILGALGRYLEWLVPSQSRAVLADVAVFLDNGVAIGVVLLATMLFFSSLAFSVLEKAMAVIFAHRHVAQKRHFLVSAVLPYGFVFLLAIALLAVTVAATVLQAVAQESVYLAGGEWSLRGLSGVLLYLLGLTAEVLILAAFYYVIPVGHTRPGHALIGGIAAAALWEIARHLLLWYFTTLSSASVVYGSLTTAVVALFAMEIAAIILLLGAQVIAEYERLRGQT